MADASAKRFDPIGTSYYSPLRTAERWSDKLFYVGAVLSFATLLVDKATSPLLYDLVQGGFVLSVIAVFVLGSTIRLHLKPRAEDMRRKELLSKASGVALTHLKTVGYYNNEQRTAVGYLGAAVMESSFFSAAILLKMVQRERIKIGIYALVFTIALLYRKTDLAFAATAAAAVFSEQLVSQWLRMEWLRMRCERTYSELYAIFQASPPEDVFEARVLEAAMLYETSKANAGIALSEGLFHRYNPQLSAEWGEITRTLHL